MPKDNTNRIVKLETMNEEVMRRLEKIDEKLDKLTQKITVSNDRMEQLVRQRDEQFKEEFITRKEAQTLDERVSNIEGYFNWGIKIILGAIITGVLYLLGIKR